jgi:hypothetical protein
MMKVGTVTATAVILFAGALWIGIGPGGSGTTYAAVLDPVLQATDGVRAVHVVLRMLTREGEDFSYVNLGAAPGEVEVWIEWPRAPGELGRARVDKVDRVYVFDGTVTSYYHPLRREIFREKRGRGFGHSLFWPAAWVRQIRNLPERGVEVLAHEESAGVGRLVLREKGADHAPLEPSFLGDFDRETEISWDLESKLLTDLRRWVLVDGERILFSELVSIEYLAAIDDAVFELDLPEGVREGGISRNPIALLELGPREVAQRFFDAAVQGDREELELFCGSPAMVDWLLDEEHRPTQVLYLGEPFRAGDYPGVYVPYKVRFGSGRGSVTTHQLALRNDNEQHRWIFDGGI